jgi:hypothetical protein
VLLFLVTVGAFSAIVLCSIDELIGLSVAESKSGSRAAPPPEYGTTGTCEPGKMNAVRLLLPVAILVEESETEDKEATLLFRDTASDAEDKAFLTYHQLVAYE